jgi:shikimate kinase
MNVMLAREFRTDVLATLDRRHSLSAVFPMPRCRRHRTRTPSDRRCGSEEPELRVSLVGVSCVGTTTIGRILADRRGWPFFDLDDEIERHFGISIERLQARFLTSYDYRKECAVVLERIATANPDCVIALPPSGLRDAFLRVVRRVPGVTVAVHDAPEKILERITFYDIDSRRIEKHLTEEERILYLKEIKADITYFKRSYERADLQVTITGARRGRRRRWRSTSRRSWSGCRRPVTIMSSGSPRWKST